MTTNDNRHTGISCVAETLTKMHGIWQDSIELFNLDGSELRDDTTAGSGTPGSSPFENLVYVDFNGEALTLTNVHIKGRPVAAKTFTGKIVDGLLLFDSLGKGAYKNIGMSGGPNIITFSAEQLSSATDIYLEPDFILLLNATERMRHTVLYRHGKAIRTLTAKGKKLSEDCSGKHALDPRKISGNVHETPFVSTIWEQ
jgi:hypothetical protein